MSTLEEALLAAAARGLTHLTLHPVVSEDRKTTYWRATATPSTMHKYVSTQSLSPVEAVQQVLAALPKAPGRRPSEITAAVTPPMALDDVLRPTENIGSTTDANKHAVPLDQLDPPPNEGLDAWLPKP